MAQKKMSTGCTEYVLAGGVLASRVIGQPEVVSLSACGGWVLCESYRLQSGLVRLSGGLEEGAGGDARGGGELLFYALARTTY